MNKKGFTLVEMVAAVLIFSFVALFASNIMIYSVKSWNRLTARFELRDEARIALDFMVTQIKHADGYNISYRSGNSLRQLDLLSTLISDGSKHTYSLRYDRGNCRLNFGGSSGYGPSVLNELASNIKDIVVIIDDDKKLMHITITAEDNGESLSLYTCVSLKHKSKINI